VSKLYILNAFSLSLLSREEQGGAPQFYSPNGSERNLQGVARWPRPVQDPEKVLGRFGGRWEVVSAVGHASTAAIFSALLGREVPCNRETVALERGDIALIGQYRGPRLEEGATALPEGAEIEWWIL
jgi:hypothetical protein